MAEPIDTLVHNFVYTADGTPARSQPGITNYSPGQFAGSFGAGTPSEGLPDAGTQILGQVVPPENSYSGTVPMPTEGAYVDLSDGLRAIHRNLELMPDTTLVWAMNEYDAKFDEARKALAPGKFMGMVLGDGQADAAFDAVNMYQVRIPKEQITNEIKRRLGQGNWTLSSPFPDGYPQ